ncbi:unnamed protein product, partial [Coccothraustes coccothraustes]
VLPFFVLFFLLAYSLFFFHSLVVLDQFQVRKKTNFFLSCWLRDRFYLQFESAKNRIFMMFQRAINCFFRITIFLGLQSRRREGNSSTLAKLAACCRAKKSHLLLCKYLISYVVLYILYILCILHTSNIFLKRVGFVLSSFQ